MKQRSFGVHSKAAVEFVVEDVVSRWLFGESGTILDAPSM